MKQITSEEIKQYKKQLKIMVKAVIAMLAIVIISVLLFV